MCYNMSHIICDKNYVCDWFKVWTRITCYFDNQKVIYSDNFINAKKSELQHRFICQHQQKQLSTIQWVFHVVINNPDFVVFFLLSDFSETVFIFNHEIVWICWIDSLLWFCHRQGFVSKRWFRLVIFFDFYDSLGDPSSAILHYPSYDDLQLNVSVKVEDVMLKYWISSLGWLSFEIILHARWYDFWIPSIVSDRAMVHFHPFSPKMP